MFYARTLTVFRIITATLLPSSFFIICGQKVMNKLYIIIIYYKICIPNNESSEISYFSRFSK